MLKEIRPVLVSDDRYITSKLERIPFCFASRPGHSLKKGGKESNEQEKRYIGLFRSFLFPQPTLKRKQEW